MAEPIGGRLSSAFRETYETAGVSQEDIAVALGVDQPTVSKWARGMRRPPLDALPVTEELARVPRGTILRLAGYVDDTASSVEHVIRSDPRLAAVDRSALLRFYELAVTAGAQANSGGGYPVDLGDPDEARLWALETYSEADRWKLIEGLREERRLAAGRAEGDVEPGQAAQ